MYENQTQDSISIGSGSSGYKQAQEVRAAPVLDEYGTLGKELQILGELVDDFRVRLEPVLGCENPEASDGQQNQAQRSLSPLGESIRSDTQRVRNITATLRSLMNRIEV